MLFLQVSAHYHPSPVAPEAGPPARYGVYPRGAAVRMYGSNAQVIANGQVVASGVALTDGHRGTDQLQFGAASTQGVRCDAAPTAVALTSVQQGTPSQKLTRRVSMYPCPYQKDMFWSHQLPGVPSSLEVIRSLPVCLFLINLLLRCLLQTTIPWGGKKASASAWQLWLNV